MAPILHCIRHAQGVHNLCIENHVIPDPDLTQLGVSQCEELARRFPYHSEIDLIVVSPIRRTIYTALYAFAERIKQGNIKIIALPEIQEVSDVPCDTGSDLPVLRKEVEEKGLPVDLSLLDDQWNVKKGKYAPIPNACMARARKARQWLKNRPESNIAVVTHGGFLHYFTEDWEDCAMYQGTGWTNTEFRSYKFIDGVDTVDIRGEPLDEDNATLQETDKSRQLRNMTKPVPSKEEQIKFFKEGLAMWDQQNAEALAKQSLGKPAEPSGQGRHPSEGKVTV